MSANKYQPHLLVLPEDDANREMANGFHLQIDATRQKQMQVLPVAGGWSKVLQRFESDHVMGMDRYPNRFMLLLIDFDGRKERLETAKASIPAGLADRVFVLGAWSDPEALKADLCATYENIGSAMADDCRKATDTTWWRNLLRHNASELDRLRQHVRPILF